MDPKGLGERAVYLRWVQGMGKRVDRGRIDGILRDRRWEPVMCLTL